MTEENTGKNRLVLLPIGSVVTLKNTEPKPLMVYSRKVITGPSEEKDYLLCPYPEGFLGEDVTFGANAADIDRVLFIGFRNEREVALQKALLSPAGSEEGTWEWTGY